MTNTYVTYVSPTLISLLIIVTITITIIIVLARSARTKSNVVKNVRFEKEKRSIIAYRVIPVLSKYADCFWATVSLASQTDSRASDHVPNGHLPKEKTEIGDRGTRRCAPERP